MTDQLTSRVAEVRARIERARESAGRSDPVTLVAVTKTYPADAVRSAVAAGIPDVGENRVQELEEKVAAVGRREARWHLIGHLQRNKVSKALPLFDLMHSLDSHRLARELSKSAVAAGTPARVLVQVNASGEESKSGFAADEAVEGIARICELPGLVVEGVMTMAPFTDDERVLRQTFARTARVQEAAARQLTGFHARYLSMGMSNDFEIAIQEGSTLVRLGTVLFGERDA